MRFLHEVRKMINDMTEQVATTTGTERQSISIAGERHTIVVNASGPVHIYGAVIKPGPPVDHPDADPDEPRKPA